MRFSTGPSMAFPRTNKIVLLLLSGEGPLWAKILHPTSPTQERISGLLSISNGSVSNWRHGHTVGDETLTWLFQTIPTQIRASLSFSKADAASKRGDKFEKSVALLSVEARELLAQTLDDVGRFVSDRKFHVYEVGNYLGIKLNRIQKLIDTAIYSRYPVFSTLYYESTERGRDKAEQDYKTYGGFYELFCRREGLWLVGSLRVRYIQEIGEGLVLRCKLNFPMVQKIARSDVDYWEYDGFLAVRSLRLFWMFEKRQFDRGDFINFVTGPQIALKDNYFLYGSYLSTGQDSAQSIVNGDIMLRQLDLSSPTEIEEKMHGSNRVVSSNEEGVEIEKLLNALKVSK